MIYKILFLHIKSLILIAPFYKPVIPTNSGQNGRDPYIYYDTLLCSDCPVFLSCFHQICNFNPLLCFSLSLSLYTLNTLHSCYLTQIKNRCISAVFPFNK
uniref:Uncharacterized protein n=1 Tax=Cacopsylla melanoneura TaxID=428564 RepID=A0A8D8XDN4_9HEMI